ncbi:M30 family zinc metallopeptidase [Chitinibacteraceae bacterium HSL-7]
MSRIAYAAVVLSGIAALTACGGGGGGGGGETAPVTTPTPIPTPVAFPAEAIPPFAPQAVADNVFSVDCSGSQCGASGNTYTGAGVGMWRYTNAAASNASVPVNLSGVSGKRVTLILTNSSSTSRTVIGGFRREDSGPLSSVAATTVPDVKRYNQIPDVIRQFSPLPFTAAASGPTQRSATRAAAYALGDTRSWWVIPESTFQSRTARLERKLTARDGRVINLWVETSEKAANKVTDSMLDTMAARFVSNGNAIYDLATQVAGQPWGAHSQANLIAPASDLDVVFVNFDNNRQPYGLLGYFYALNNYTGQANSNEALSFYMDTETLYLDSQYGLERTLGTLAHELTHMVNFYGRVVKPTESSLPGSYTFETFAEEMVATMMEDLIAERAGFTTQPLRDDAYAAWLSQGAFNCSFTNWDGSLYSACFGYPIVQNFGGYLLRQFGVPFYTDLLTNLSSNADSVTQLDRAIQRAGGIGFADALRRWSTSIARLPGNSPATFGHPSRTSSGYTLPAVHGPSFATRYTPMFGTATSLNGYAHIAVDRYPTTADFVETIQVPPGTSLSVVVQ